MKLVRIKLRNRGVNEFGRPGGAWVTEEQIDALVRNLYDPELCDKPIKMAGDWVYPKDFIGKDKEAGERELEDLMESSATFSSEDIKGLAEAGYLAEVKKVSVGTGFNSFVNKLVESGKYQLESGDKKKKELGVGKNKEGLARLEQMKKAKGLS